MPFLCVLLWVKMCLGSPDWSQLVIAHRGSSAYLPEHTLEAKTLAVAMDADYLEQDLVLSKDGWLIVWHDLELDGNSDVHQAFPERHREDGKHYVIDFTLAELQKLRVTERVELGPDGKEVPKYPDRFPIWKSRFRIHTLQEELELIQGLEKTMQRRIGIYPEIKSPWFHTKEGHCIRCELMKALVEYGYRKKSDPVFVQCFDPRELRLIREEQDIWGANFNLVQLLSYNDWNETLYQTTDLYGNSVWLPYDAEWMLRSDGMRKIAEYAQGVGPWFPMVVDPKSTKDNLILSPLVAEAHEFGLKVHPYTFRADCGKIPEYAKDFQDFLRIFFEIAHVDGVFTDFPDKVVAYLKRHS